LESEEAMGVMNSIMRAIWGVQEPPAEITAPIDCEECRVARIAGKDACPEHHHHAFSRRHGHEAHPPR
jgi:hypothetical protein